MPHANILSRPHFNSYHHNDSLLFQFILTEFLSSHKAFKTARMLTQDLKKSFPEAIDEPRLLDKHMHALLESIVELAGSSSELMRIFSWSLDHGILAKLKNYCSYLSQIYGEEDRDVRALERNAHKSWSASLQILDTLRSLLEYLKLPVKKAKEQKSNIRKLFETFFEQFKKLIESHRAFARNLKNLMPQFREDENVVFFIVSQHELLDDAYGNAFTADLLTDMYPKGIKEAGLFLQKKYAQRGFEQLLPVITNKIALIRSTAS